MELVQGQQSSAVRRQSVDRPRSPEVPPLALVFAAAVGPALPAETIGARQWQPARVPHKVGAPRTERKGRLMERIKEKAAKAQEREQLEGEGSPRLGSPRNRKTYEGMRGTLDLVSATDLKPLKRSSIGNEEEVAAEAFDEEKGRVEEEKLNKVREFAVEWMKEHADSQAHLLTVEELKASGLSRFYSVPVRIVPMDNTVLFRAKFIAKGGQKEVWASREFSVVKGTWCRAVVEYECLEDEVGADQVAAPESDSDRRLKEFIKELGPSEGFPPAAYRIGSNADGSKALYKQNILFDNSILTIDARIDFMDAIHLYRDAAKALAYLHRNNVVHRDVKGANILICALKGHLSDLDEICWVGDKKARVETMQYAAPEHSLPRLPISVHSDEWAFGLTLWQGFYGWFHFDAESEGRIEKTLPPVFKRITERYMPDGLIKLTDAEIEAGLDFGQLRYGASEERLRGLIEGLLKHNPEHRLPMDVVVQGMEEVVVLFTKF